MHKSSILLPQLNLDSSVAIWI